MRALVWISFDLGIRGDFEGMYHFLDDHEAKECGDSIATFRFEYKKDLLAELLKELKANVTFDRRSRVYAIYSNANGKISGKFLIGKRKVPAWSGFGSAEHDEVDIDE